MSEHEELVRANPNVVVRAAPLPQFVDTPQSRQIVNAAPFPQLVDETTIVTPAILHALAIPAAAPSSVSSLAVIFDLLGIFQDADNDFSAIFSIPPAIRGYYPDETSTVTETVFINSLFAARAVPLTPRQRQQVTGLIQGVVVGSRSVSGGVDTLLRLYQ